MSSHRSVASCALAAFGLVLSAPIVHAQDNGDALLHVLTDPGNRLVTFRAGSPQTPLSRRVISGVGAGETLVGLDARAANGDLIALSDANKLYRIDAATANATAIGAAAFAPALAGAAFGFDFNPLVDRIRCVSDAEQNLRLHPDTGAVAGVDAPLAYAAGDVNFGVAPDVVGAAYTNSFPGSATTTLYAIDAATNALVTQGSIGGAPVSPNAGSLFTIGALGFDVGSKSHFDISVFGGAFLVNSSPATFTNTLYSVDLASGAATALGNLAHLGDVRGLAIAAPRAPRAFAVTASNRLVAFPAGQPSKILSDVAITGLPGGEDLVAIDFRPATMDLLALSSQSKLYRLDTKTGVATAIGAGPFSPALFGSAFGFDFNPTVDRIRLVSDLEQNLRLHPVTGAVAGVDTALAYDLADVNAGLDPNVVAEAYTNNFAGSTVTTLYGIDSNTDALVLQGSQNASPISPNAGTLFTVGALGIDTTSAAAFDISDLGGALAVFTAPGASSSTLHRVNLQTGAATLVGTIGVSEPVRGFAIEPTQRPRLYGLTTTGKLVSFLAGSPDVLLSSLNLVGLAAGESVVGIDFRPATGELVGVTDTSRVVKINRFTGRVLYAGPAFTPAVSGLEFGIDFNPVPDRIRLVSDAEQNLRLNPNNGAIGGVDTMLAFDAGDANFGANPEATGAAYTASFAGAKKTTLFDLDTGKDALVRQGSIDGAPVSPNSGLLFTVGSFGIDATSLAGFDIGAIGGGFACLTPVGAATSTLYRVNLSSGAVTALGVIGGDTLRDLAIVPPGAN